jgi:hypothetical protein
MELKKWEMRKKKKEEEKKEINLAEPYQLTKAFC